MSHLCTTYAYSPIGNITSKSGLAYNYGAKPHAVTSVGQTTYAYDNNGNMTARGAQTLAWSTENQLSAVAGETYVYDGDGVRVKKVSGGQTTVYVNKYYEKTFVSWVDVV